MIGYPDSTPTSSFGLIFFVISRYPCMHRNEGVSQLTIVSCFYKQVIAWRCSFAWL